MREIVKQIILLEDHLFQECKRCPDCVKKHFLTIEGLAEECRTLCLKRGQQESADAAIVARRIRVLQHAWESRKGECKVATAVAMQLRQLRKPLMGKYASLPVDALPSDETRDVAHVLTRVGKT